MVGVSGRGGKNSKAVREFKASGNKAMQAGAFQKAMRLYTRALDLDAGNPILYSNRSAAHFNLRQFAESLEDAESAILCDATWWKAYKRKGLALIHMQKYGDAIAALEEGLNIVKKNAEMEKNLEFAKACQEQAQNLYILPEPHMMQRLESVPVFIVTDNVGQPFFVTYDDGQQVCTFYFDQEDAIATLDWIKSENPGLGDTARVIHITLHQAFNLAQETQKQYYEETTRAAAEEDRIAAEAAKNGTVIVDVDGDEDEADDSPNSSTDSNMKEAVEGTTADTENDKPTEEVTEISAEQKDEVKMDTESDGNDGKQDGIDGQKLLEQREDDTIIDESAPLSFQFRPELRQVKVAVDLLNKHPNPPVRPILRDPPSVRKAKAEAAAAADTGKVVSGDEGNAEGDNQEEGNTAMEADKMDSCVSKTDTENVMHGEADKKEESVSDEASKKGEVSDKTENKGKVVSDEADKEDIVGDEADKEEVVGDETDREKVVMGKADNQVLSGGADSGVSVGGRVEEIDGDANGDGEVSKVLDEEELTVDNFNGIPIFQAKGLTLLQKDKQLIPLFFSKWDLEKAWKQLKDSNALDVPGDCEIDVGTLEDVLRRMSESKTDEFQSVFFVPSREAMKAINVKFPLDELAASNAANGSKLSGKPAVKKANFSKAKQIAARGGSKDEIRAAIKEDLEKHAERVRMAEIIAQIEQAGRNGGALGRVGAGSSLSGASSGASSGKNVKAAKAGTVA